MWLAALVFVWLAGPLSQAGAPSAGDDRPSTGWKPVPHGLPQGPPALVVQITVDGLRPDTVRQVSPRLLEGGFRRLLERGVDFRNARYRHVATYTAPGHATLVTGAYPRDHGIVANRWYENGTGVSRYSVGDARYPMVGEAADPDRGRAPTALLTRTIGDELVTASGGRSRAFSVSIKDRAAVLCGGHSGQAYWYDEGTGRFVTSTYYRSDYPDWARQWNDADPGAGFRDRPWTLAQPRGTYQAREDDRPDEQPPGTLGRTFPHSLADGSRSDVYKTIRFTPYADELLLSFVKALVEGEGLGRSASSDYLAIGFSATDYIQHAWGPGSLEAEDNVLRLDATLADLFTFLDRTVGSDRVLIVLSADHGFDEIPEVRLGEGVTAGRHQPARFMARANETLRSRFGISEDLVYAFTIPSLYLDVSAIARLRLDQRAVEETVASVVRLEPGMAMTATRSDLMSGRNTSDPWFESLRMAFHPERSGHVLVVQDRFWSLNNDPKANAAMHGSPYDYDVTVPLVFCGPGIPPAVVTREVGVEDAAPTIAACLGIGPLNGATGRPLPEVVGR